MKKFKKALAIALISIALTAGVGSAVSACVICGNLGVDCPWPK